VIREAPEGGDSSIVWQAGTKSRTDLGLDDLSDAQRRWAVRAIVLALRRVERFVAHAARSTERFEAETAQLRERRENVDRARRRHEESKREKDLYREWHEEHLHEHAAQVDWKTSQGLEPDVFEADYDVDDLLEDETKTERAGDRIQEMLASIAEIDPHQRAANHLRRFPQSPLVLLMDEPEAGLHRTAERDIVRLLVDVANEQETTTFVATHSPEFLRDRRVRAFVTKRDEWDNTVIDDSLEILGGTAGDYGLSRLDVLHLYETILLVEGRHDEIVLTRLIGDQLRHLRVLVIPLHGGRLMPDAADARILQDFTDHRIVALVDNLDPTKFVDLLAAARNIAPGDVDEFDAVADRVLDGRKDSDEVGFIRRLLRRAFEHGRLERFGVYGLSAPDILEYLSSDPFGLDRSWAELRIEFDKQTKIKRFKRWLELTKGASFADDHVEAACARMDELPEDLTGLLALLAAGDERT
jgi:energy-coupling factor transporter ATP-binding protein EcfA2